MPKGEKDDGLDGEELDDGVERAQEVLGGHVEQVERVQGDRDADVVDDRGVEVAQLGAPVTVLVEAVRLKEERGVYCILVLRFIF